MSHHGEHQHPPHGEHQHAPHGLAGSNEIRDALEALAEIASVLAEKQVECRGLRQLRDALWEQNQDLKEQVGKHQEELGMLQAAVAQLSNDLKEAHGEVDGDDDE